MRLEMLHKEFLTLEKRIGTIYSFIFLKISDIARWKMLYTSCSTVLIKSSNRNIWKGIYAITPKKE